MSGLSSKKTGPLGGRKWIPPSERLYFDPNRVVVKKSSENAKQDAAAQYVLLHSRMKGRVAHKETKEEKNEKKKEVIPSDEKFIQTPGGWVVSYDSDVGQAILKRRQLDAKLDEIRKACQEPPKKTKLCKKYLQGKCSNTPEDCKYLHQKKSEICPDWMLSISASASAPDPPACRLGDLRCPFRHEHVPQLCACLKCKICAAQSVADSLNTQFYLEHMDQYRSDHSDSPISSPKPEFQSQSQPPPPVENFSTQSQPVSNVAPHPPVVLTLSAPSSTQNNDQSFPPKLSMVTEPTKPYSLPSFKPAPTALPITTTTTATFPLQNLVVPKTALSNHATFEVLSTSSPVVPSILGDYGCPPQPPPSSKSPFLTSTLQNGTAVRFAIEPKKEREKKTKKLKSKVEKCELDGRMVVVEANGTKSPNMEILPSSVSIPPPTVASTDSQPPPPPPKRTHVKVFTRAREAYAALHRSCANLELAQRHTGTLANQSVTVEIKGHRKSKRSTKQIPTNDACCLLGMQAVATSNDQQIVKQDDQTKPSPSPPPPPPPPSNEFIFTFATPTKTTIPKKYKILRPQTSSFNSKKKRDKKRKRSVSPPDRHGHIVFDFELPAAKNSQEFNLENFSKIPESFLEQQVSQIGSEMKILKEKLNEVRTKLEKERKREKEKWQQKLEKMEREVEEAKRQRDRALEELSDLKASLASVSAELNNDQKGEEGCSKQGLLPVPNGSAVELDRQISEMRVEIGNLQRTRMSLLSEISGFQTRIAHSQSVLRNFMIMATLQQRTHAQQQIGICQNGICMAQRGLTQAESRIQVLAPTIVALEARRAFITSNSAANQTEETMRRRLLASRKDALLKSVAEQEKKVQESNEKLDEVTHRCADFASTEPESPPDLSRFLEGIQKIEKELLERQEEHERKREQWRDSLCSRVVNTWTGF